MLSNTSTSGWAQSPKLPQSREVESFHSSWILFFSIANASHWIQFSTILDVCQGLRDLYFSLLSSNSLSAPHKYCPSCSALIVCFCARGSSITQILKLPSNFHNHSSKSCYTAPHNSQRYCSSGPQKNMLQFGQNECRIYVYRKLCLYLMLSKNKP